MIWRFTIIDRNNNSTVIDEPVGWDNNVIELNRDPNWHGVFFSSQGETFEYSGEAMNLLISEYDTYGVEGEMQLKIEQLCGNEYVQLSMGKFMFKDFEFVCGDDCRVKIPTESATSIREIRSRINQKVNLESLKAFDGITNLTPYSMLPFSLDLPAKGIFIKDSAMLERQVTESFNTGLQPVMNTGWNLTYSAIELAMKVDAAEIGSFSMQPVSEGQIEDNGHLMTLLSQNANTTNIFPDAAGHAGLWPLSLSPVLNYFEETPNYGDVSNPVDIALNLQGTIEVMSCIVRVAAFYLLRLKDRPDFLQNGEDLSHYDVVYSNYYYGNYWDGTPGAGTSTNITVNSLFTGQYTIEKGDRFYMFMAITDWKNQGHLNAINAPGSTAYAIKLTLNKESYFKITNLSKTQPSKASVFPIYEATSRIVESITNGKVKANSSLLGRTDSEPFYTIADGCASLLCITDGIRLREQEKRIPDNPSLYNVSLQDIFDGLSPIFNIGIGLENSVSITPEERLIVESWEYFYNNSITFECTNINKITKRTEDKEIFSTFQIGYEKWEAEEYTGLDEILTKRTFRTTLTGIKNDLIKLSKFIASPYAIEITRRKKANSKDWRYDKNNFVICLMRQTKFFVAFSNFPQHKMRIRVASIPVQQQFLALTSITIANSLNAGTYTIVSASVNDGYVELIVVESFPAPSFASSAATFPSLALSNNLSVEIDNIESPENIIDFKTLYNFRISPLRNAMRWVMKLFAGYKNYGSQSKLIFNDGEANYYAKGKLKNGCVLENAPIRENVDVDYTLFTDTTYPQPVLAPERIVFDYPLTTNDYALIENNKYGLIGFHNDCCSGYGWIDSIKYNPEEGFATFTLIPKF